MQPTVSMTRVTPHKTTCAARLGQLHKFEQTRPSAELSLFPFLRRYWGFMLTLTVLGELEVDDLVDSTGMYLGAASIIAVRISEPFVNTTVLDYFIPDGFITTVFVSSPWDEARCINRKHCLMISSLCLPSRSNRADRNRECF